MNGLERWHHVMKEGDMETLYDLLHPEGFLKPPLVLTQRDVRLKNK